RATARGARRPRPRAPAGVLPRRRVVHAVGAADHRRSLLAGASTAEGARAAPGARGRGRDARALHAAAPARVRARGRSRLSLLTAAALEAALRQHRQLRHARHLSAAAVLEELRAPSAELVRAGAP